MFRSTKIISVLAAAAAVFAFAQPTFAQGQGMTLGIGGAARAPAPGRPAYISTYSAPALPTSTPSLPTFTAPATSNGAFIQPNFSISYNTQSPTFNAATNISPTAFSGTFVPPPVIVQPSFVAPNYYLPGDFYARSTYFVPTGASPIITYGSPVNMGNGSRRPTGVSGGFVLPTGGGYHSTLTYGPLSGRR